MYNVQYLFTSPFGSFMVDCEVLKKLEDGKFLIKFYDTVLEDNVEKIVNIELLKFPQFADFGNL